MRSIAFIGAGPTTLYTLSELLRLGARGGRFVVFEARSSAGQGMPYRADWNDPAMLANIASAEIPPLAQTLLSWLQTQAAPELSGLGVDPGRVDDRTFVPRLALGRYFEAQFETIVAGLQALGNVIEVRTGQRVADISRRPDGMRLTCTTSPSGDVVQALFDQVVLATGHQWPSPWLARPGCFRSPWPASALADVGPVDIAVRGSSLSAIDTVFALATRHGTFVTGPDGVVYRPGPGSDSFRVTLMSRKGLLPEADFYFPLPHAPTDICTPDAVDSLIREGRQTLLDDVFDLVRRELELVDPGYAAAHCPEGSTVETFAEAYFAERVACDPFAWARRNLAEARAGHAPRSTTPWRDALLRLHEIVAWIAPHLDDQAFERFSGTLKPVLVDAYGAVPHESVERLLALHDAGKLAIIALGEDHALDFEGVASGVQLIGPGVRRRFPVFVEATGQKPLGALQFPFLTLLQQGIVRDAFADGEGPARGIEIDECFRVVAPGLEPDRLYCLSLPFIMGRHPFAQGLTSSHAMGRVVAGRLAALLSSGAGEVDTLAAVA